MSNIKDGIEGIGDKMKAASKAAATKVKDPEKDIDTEYQKEKMVSEKSSADPTKVSKLIPSSIPEYKRILVPDDNSELSNQALSHAIYLSNVTGAGIVMLNIVKDIGKIQPTTISATTTKEGGEVVAKNTAVDQKKDIQITIEGHAEQMMEERIRLCKESGAKNQVSYKMLTG